MGIENLVNIFVDCPGEAPLADDVILEDFGQSKVYRGRSAVLSVIDAYFRISFPDAHMSVQTTLSSEQRLVIAFTFNGRQAGVFFGLPATGREVAVPMVLLFRTAGRWIQHIAWYYDAGTMLRQLGFSLT